LQSIGFAGFEKTGKKVSSVEMADEIELEQRCLNDIADTAEQPYIKGH
jgi:hypothetical protein